MTDILETYAVIGLLDLGPETVIGDVIYSGRLDKLSVDELKKVVSALESIKEEVFHIISVKYKKPLYKPNKYYYIKLKSGLVTIQKYTLWCGDKGEYYGFSDEGCDIEKVLGEVPDFLGDANNEWLGKNN